MAGLPWLWLLLVLLGGLRLAVCLLRLRRLEQRCASASIPPCLVLAVAEASAQLAGQRPLPRLILGPAGSMPMVWGILRPRLLLPADAADWAPERLRAVLLHELSHLLRQDPAALLLAQVAQALHWFNPLAWSALHRLRTEQEHACDDAVLRHGIRASDYAQHLLDLARHQTLAPGLGLCALAVATPCGASAAALRLPWGLGRLRLPSFIDHSPIESRLLAILDPSQPRSPASHRSVASALLCTVLIALPVAMLAQGKLQRGRILDRHGVALAESRDGQPRSHPYKALAAHVLGYTRGEPPANGGDAAPRIGWSGLEKTGNDALAAGRDLPTTIDARAQSIAERALAEAGVGRGAVVLLDPRSGEVLAMASVPNYDPSSFEPRISVKDYSAIADNKAYPFMNRAIQPYAPGSAFMLLPSLAAAQEGLGDTSFECSGSVSYGSRVMECWIKRQFQKDGHGKLGLSEALTRSCNCYFYQLGNKLGDQSMARTAHSIGLGELTGIELANEGAGVYPSEQWVADNRPDYAGKNFSPGILANTSIGQGYVTATPLQMAMLAATVANGGQPIRPRLLQRSGPDKEAAKAPAPAFPAAQVELIRKVMWDVVNGDIGTAKAARSSSIVIAGKTGTAQNWRSVTGQTVADNHTWFIGFAPYEQPTLAFAVLVQGGKSGGSTCAPIAKRIVEQTLALPADGSGKIEPSEPQPGHFLPVSEIDYDNANERVQPVREK